MSFVTYGTLRQEIEKEMDLEEESFIQPLEMISYANEAIRTAEGYINELCEDYFLDYEALSLVSAQQTYDLPADVYANKLRAVMYKNGSTIYRMKRLRYSDSFEDIEDRLLYGGSNTEYNYIITNDATAGYKINILPVPQESGDFVRVWYLRNAKQLTLNTTTAESETIDIPEFRHFIKQFMKVKIYEKEVHPNLGLAVQQLEQEKQKMIASLTDRFADGDNELEYDTTHYQEHT